MLVCGIFKRNLHPKDTDLGEASARKSRLFAALFGVLSKGAFFSENERNEYQTCILEV